MSKLPCWADVLESRVKAGLAPGIVALAAYPDHVEVSTAGYQDVRRGVPMARDTLFRIASVSKIITAAGAMTLVDDGSVDLDEPVGRWLPELSGKAPVRDLYGAIDAVGSTASDITLRHLLSMTNGMGSFFGQTAYSPLIDIMNRRGVTSWTAPVSSDELRAGIADLPLMFEPGKRWLYHLGLELAGVLIERVTGCKLGAFLKERLFEPLQMADTGFSVSTDKVHRLAQLYSVAGAGRYQEVADWEADRSVAPRMDRGGGGLISSADDLGKLGRLFLDDGMVGGRQILSKASVREMTRDQVSPEAKANSPVFPGFWEAHGFGLGMCVVNSPNWVSQTPGRFGWWGGTGTALFADPTRNVAMVCLTQRMIQSLDDSGNADSFMQAVLSE